MKTSLPAQISQVRTMVDRGIRITIDSGELPPDVIAELFKLKESEIATWVLFADRAIQPDEAKSLPEPKLDKNEKSPSQRLRNTLFVLWEQRKLSQDFDTFYKMQIEKFIDAIKERLEPKI